MKFVAGVLVLCALLACPAGANDRSDLDEFESFDADEFGGAGAGAGDSPHATSGGGQGRVAHVHSVGVSRSVADSTGSDDGASIQNQPDMYFLAMSARLISHRSSSSSL